MIISAVDKVARECGIMSLLMGLPGALLLRYELTPDEEGEGGRVRRIASDDSGIVEDDTISLDHACLSCTAREDIVPTLRRLAEQGRWQAIVLSLPLAAAPEPVVWQIQDAARHAGLPVRLTPVLSIVDSATLLEDAFGDELLDDRGLAIGGRDPRSVAEALGEQMDYADLVCLLDEPAGFEASVVHHLVQPTERLIPVLSEINAMGLLHADHDMKAAKRRLDPVRVPDAACAAHDSVDHGLWSLELVSDRPFHPERLIQEIELLGGGPLRIRGCFHLPTRPRAICAFHAAGGQIAIGGAGLWGHRPPQTRLVIQGCDPQDRGRVQRAFNDLLLTDFEIRSAHQWIGVDDQLDDFLGAESREAG